MTATAIPEAESAQIPTAEGEPPKAVFRYFDGTRQRRGDPLAILMRINEHIREEGYELKIILDTLDRVQKGIIVPGNDPESTGQIRVFIDAVNQGFKTKLLDESDDDTGLEHSEIVDNFFAVMDFQVKKNQSIEDSPNSSTPSDGLPAESNGTTKPVEPPESLENLENLSDLMTTTAFS